MRYPSDILNTELPAPAVRRPTFRTRSDGKPYARPKQQALDFGHRADLSVSEHLAWRTEAQLRRRRRF